MRAVVLCVELGSRCAQSGVVRERTQQIIVAAPRFVRAGKDCIDHAQLCSRVDPLPGDAGARTHAAAERRGMLQRAYDRSSNGDDAPAASSAATDRASGARGDEIRLRERQSPIEVHVARR